MIGFNYYLIIPAVIGNGSGHLQTHIDLIRISKQNTWLKQGIVDLHTMSSSQQLPECSLGHTGFARCWVSQKPRDTSSWNYEVCLRIGLSSPPNSVSGLDSHAEQLCKQISPPSPAAKLKCLCIWIRYFLKRVAYLLFDKTSSVTDSKNKVLVRVFVQRESTGRQLEV